MSAVLLGALISVGAVVLLILGFWMYVIHLGHKEKVRLKEMRARFPTGKTDRHY